MGANTVEIKINAQKDPAASNVRAIGAELGKLGNAAGKAGSSIGSAIAGAGRAFGVATNLVAGFGVAAIAALGSAVKSTVEWSNQVERLSRELGITTQQASALIDVSDDLGVSAQTLSMGFGIFARNLAGIPDLENMAAEGGTQFSEVLGSLGIAMNDSSGKLRNMNDMLPEIADRFMRMPDGLEKSALAMQLFGRSGKDLIPVLNLGSAAMAKAAKDTERFGLAMSAENVQAARAFQVATSNVTDAIRGLALTIGNEVMPMLIPYIEKITEGIVAVKDFVKEHKEAISQLLLLGAAIGGPLAGIKGLSMGAGLLGVNLGGVGGIIGGVAKALVGLNPVVLLVGGVLALLVGSIKKFLDIGKPVPQMFEEWGSPMAQTADQANSLGATLGKLAGGAVLVAKIVYVALSDMGKWVGDVFDDLTTRIAHGWTIIGEDMGSWGQSFAEFWQGIGTFLGNWAGDVIAFWSGWLQDFGELWTPIIEWVAKAWDFIVDAIKWARAKVAEILEPWLSGIASAFKTVWGAVIGVTASAWEWWTNIIGSNLAKVANFIAGWLEKLPGGMGTGLASGLREVAGVLNSGLGTIAIDAVKGFAADMGGLDMGNLLQNIKDALSPPELYGPSILDRIKAQLQSGWASVKATLADIVARAKALKMPSLPSWKPSAGTPSTPWTPAATSAAGATTGGAASGATGGATALEDPLARAANLLRSITDAISGAMDAFGKLAGYDISTTKFAAGWALLLAQIKITINGLADMLKSMGFEGEAGATKMAGLQSFVDVVGSVGNAIGSVAQAFTLLIKWKAPTQQSVAVLLRLVEDVVWALQQSASKMDKLAFPAVKLLAETASAVADMIGKTVDAFAEAAKFKTIPAGAFAPLANAIERWVLGLTNMANLFTTEGLKAARDLADTAGVIGTMLASVVQPLADAAKFKPIIMGAYAAIADAIERWVKGLIAMSTLFTDEGLLAAQNLANTAGLIGGVLASVMQPLKDAAKFRAIPAGAFGPLADSIKRWIEGLNAMFNALEAGGVDLPRVELLSNTIGNVAGALTSMIAALSEVVKYTTAATLPAAIDALVDDIKTAIKAIQTGFSGWDDDFIDAIGRATACANLASALLAPISSMMASLTTIAEYASAGGLSAALTAFLTDMGDMVGRMVINFGAWSDDTIETIQLATANAILANDLLAPVSSMVASLQALAAYAHVEGLDAALTAFFEDYGDVAGRLWLTFQGWSRDFRESIVAATENAIFAAALLTPVAGMVASLQAIAAYVRGKNLSAAMAAFFVDIAIVVETMRANFYDWDEAYRDLVTAATENANLAASVLNPLASMIGSLNAIAAYESAGATLRSAMSALMIDVAIVAETMRLNFYDWSDAFRETMADATAAAVLVGNLLNPVATMVSSLQAIADYAPKADLTAALTRFMHDVTIVAETMRTQFMGWNDTLHDTMAEAAEAAGITGNLLSPISTMVSALQSLATYASPAAGVAGAIGRLLHDVVWVAEMMRIQFMDWSDSFRNSMTAASEASGVVGQLLSPITTIVDSLTAITRYIRRPSQMQIGNVVADMRSVIDALYEMLVDIGGGGVDAIKGALAKVKSLGEAGQALQPVFSAIGGLLDTMIKLGGWYKPQDFGVKMTAFQADVVSLINGVLGIQISPDQKAALDAMGKNLLPVVQAVSEMMNIFARVKFYAPLDARKLDTLFADINLFVERASNTTNWGNLGEAATASWVQGLANGLADETARGELDRRMAEIQGRFDWANGAGGVEHIYNVTQNYTATVSGNTFVTQNDEQIALVARRVVEEILQTMGLRQVQGNNMYIPQI